MPRPYSSTGRTPLDQWSREDRFLQDLLPISQEGLVVLGTEAAGEFALPLGPWAAAVGETRARAAKACKLVDAFM